MDFVTLFIAMLELSYEGNEFFERACAQYKYASADEQVDMRKWLLEQFENYDPDDMSVKNALLLLQYG